MATHVKPRENFLRWYETARSLHLGRSGCYRVLKLEVAIDYTGIGGIDIANHVVELQGFVAPFFMLLYSNGALLRQSNILHGVGTISFS